MQDTSDSMQRVAGLAATQIDRLAEANHRQEEIWQQIQGSMRQYQQVFGQVENTASDLLTQIGEHLNNYRETVRQGYEELIKMSDEHIGNAVSRLGGSIKDLDEYLQDLNEILEKSSRDGGSHGTERR
jgi:DNA anti-recombination protein RmuC